MEDNSLKSEAGTVVGHESRLDEDDRLRPDYVRDVVQAARSNDAQLARDLVGPLHPADIADLIELTPPESRSDLVRALGPLIDGDVLAELNDYVREALVDSLAPEAVATLASDLDTDDAVALIEDLEAADQAAVLRALAPDDRAAIEAALSYPEDSAGRLMQRELIAVPEHLTVGQVIDYLRTGVMRDGSSLAIDFWEVFVVDPSYRPIGTCQLSWILRTPREIAIADVMKREQFLIPVDMDQEEIGLRFQKYGLISAAVVDESGRLVGMITVDDIVHVIQEEAGEDILKLSGAGDGDINEPIRMTIRTRVIWLIVNLGTAMIAASVIGLFEGEISRNALLAVLMPIIASMGGNAGTQTMAVTVRALATNQLTSSNTWRMIGREFQIALANGSILGVLIGSIVALWFANPMLGLVMATSMLINNLVAGLAGILIPMGLDRSRVDPAVSSAVFVTMATDVLGYLSFLGLATLAGV